LELGTWDFFGVWSLVFRFRNFSGAWCLVLGVSLSGGSTYIQRVHTVGGLAPTTPGTTGEEVLVPYIADHYFYQAE
jgi:hypothetical protein